MKHHGKLVSAVITMVLLMAGGTLADTCLECHKDPDYRVKNLKLYNYYQEFESSVHGVAGLDCIDCHGGDPQATDSADIHKGVLEPVRFDRIPDTCGRCHGPQREAFVTSEHYQILEGDGTAPNCATCHGSMEMDFIFVTRVKSTCLYCHNAESGIAPEVPTQADYVLNKINVMKGYRSFVNTHAKDRDLVAALNIQYDELTAKWHRFDLDAIEKDTQALLGEYRKAKGQALKDRKNKD